MKIDTLLLDTSGHLLLSAFDKTQKHIESVYCAEKKNAARIHSQIYQLFQKHSSDFKNITNIILTQGPGSYTGLRVGQSVAELGELFGINCYGLYLFEVPLMNGHTKGIWVSNAFKSEFFYYKWENASVEKGILPNSDWKDFKESNDDIPFFHYHCDFFPLDENKEVRSSLELLKANPSLVCIKALERGEKLYPYYYRDLKDEFSIKSKTKNKQ